MDAQDLANTLFGASRVETTTPITMSTFQGVAMSDSENGTVKVKIAGESIPNDSDATEENTVVELPTTPAVKEGDTVVVTTEGGVLKTMTVTGNIGSGDKVTQDVDDASKVAKDFIQLTSDNDIIIGNLSDAVAQNDATNTNIIFECTGTLSKNDTEVALVNHIHEGLFCTQSVSVEVTITEGKGFTASITLPTVEGYVPFALRSFHYGGFSGLFLLNYYFADNSTRFVYTVNSTSSSTQTGTVKFEFLYIKDGWM